MKFAPFMLFQKPPGRGDDRSILKGEMDTMVEAEALGYDAVHIAEHVFSPYSLASSPPAVLGALAARTRTIRLGISVVVLPLSPPLRTAADWATLDIISDGRVEMGVGRGYNWYEFDSLGLKLRENSERFMEHLQIVRQAWMQDRGTPSWTRLRYRRDGGVAQAAPAAPSAIVLRLQHGGLSGHGRASWHWQLRLLPAGTSPASRQAAHMGGERQGERSV